MIAVGGTDFTLPIVIIIVFILLAVLEYFICKKTNRGFLKLLLLIVPLGFLAEIPFTLMGNSGGFLDLRPLAVFLEVAAAALCAVAIGTGWLVYKLKNK